MIFIDIDLPDHCLKCPLTYYNHEWDHYICPFAPDEILNDMERLSNCPLTNEFPFREYTLWIKKNE